MNDFRIKLAAVALALGLGGLGGYAMSSNRAATHQAAAVTPTPTTRVIRRTVHVKPKHTQQAQSAAPPPSSPGTSQASSLTSAPVSTGSSGASSSAPSHSPVHTGSSGGGASGGGHSPVHTGSSGGGASGGEGGDRGEGGD